MLIRSRSNGRNHTLGLASRSLLLPRAMGMDNIRCKRVGGLWRYIRPPGRAIPRKARSLDIGFVMTIRIRRLLYRALALPEAFVEPRSEPSAQGSEQHDVDQQ